MRIVAGLVLIAAALIAAACTTDQATLEVRLAELTQRIAEREGVIAAEYELTPSPEGRRALTISVTVEDGAGQEGGLGARSFSDDVLQAVDDLQQRGADLVSLSLVVVDAAGRRLFRMDKDYDTGTTITSTVTS